MELTIEITNRCDHECSYCSTNAKSGGEQFLTFDEVYKFLNKQEHSIDRINISGGEPLEHRDFYRILRLCELKCDDVRVYTNAFKHIVYNSNIIPELTVEANVCLVPGEKVYISKTAHKVHFLKLINQGRAKNLPVINSVFSGMNCKSCKHALLQADGKVVKAPCKTQYGDKK